MNFKDILGKYKKRIDDEIGLFLDKEKVDNGFLDRAIRDYIMDGGKRIRPIAMIAGFEALKGKEDKIVMPAIGIEFLHNSTLCHDDIMDEDIMRRNKNSCHKAFQNIFLEKFKEREYSGNIFSKESSRFGVSNAIIAGNIFNYFGYKCFSESGFDAEVKEKAIKRINEIMIGVNHGQELDLLYENKENITEKEYLDMISKKTALLLGGAFEIGAIFAETDKEKQDSFFNYGFNLGMGFQIIDDIMDVDEKMNKGHERGSDIKKGKRTIIVIKALEKCDKKEKGFVNKVLNDENCSDEEIKKVIDIFRQKGAIDYARGLASEKIECAKDVLIRIGNDLNREYVNFFESLADYFIERKI
ncbi:MAG: polyprenyl synthetase family protein [Nanoarchaeota archaeon]|nr:polyprenyl synthetase family protein [Nanoarchaeota archaeon]